MIEITDFMVRRAYHAASGNLHSPGTMKVALNAAINFKHEGDDHCWVMQGAGGGQGTSTEAYVCECGATKEIKIVTPRKD